MNSVYGDLKYVVRGFARSPVFTAIVLLTLAIGIGANTALFSVLDGVLLKPLSYPDAERLVGVWQKAPGLGLDDLNASPSTYFTYREEALTFEDIGIWQGDSVSVTGKAEPEQVPAVDVTDGLLPLLGAKPVLGRVFSRRDDSPGTPGTVLLTYSYWQKRFGGERSVIGQRLMVDGSAREIIGVLGPKFHFLDRQPALILPLQLNEQKSFVGNFSYQAVARLKPRVTLAQANEDVARMLPIMSRKFKPAPGISMQMLEHARIGPNLRPLKQDVVGDIGKLLWVLMTTVGIVLLIACANVANLLLVRAEGRQQELAIRAALGAGWRRISQQLLFESLLLAFAGGVLGLGLAYAALRGLIAAGPTNLPRLAEISIDPSALLFSLAISVITGLLFGLMPVLKYGNPQLGTALREGGRALSEGRQRHRARSILVVVQVALALLLLVSSGLMIRTLFAMKQVRPGFTNPEQILTLRVFIPESQVREPERVVRMQEDMARRIGAVNGVLSVGLANSITMDGQTDNDPVFLEDHSYAEGKLPPLRRYKFVSPGFFKTMGNPLLAGRDLTWADQYERRNVVVVSENFARENWGSPASALGKRIRETANASWREIVGVVGQERDDGVNKKAPAVVYWPMLLNNFWGNAVQVRRTQAFAIRSGRAGSAQFLDEVRRAIWSVNPQVPLADVRTVEQIYDRSLARTSFALVMLAVAGSMALLLGVLGIYGVISYSVLQRTREIGIRMALGAQQRAVRQMFIRHGLGLTSVGVLCGVIAALAEMRLLSALLFEVSPFDPLTYCIVSVVLVIAAYLASYLPARRATGIDPVEALRAE
jgi:predicted permease